MAGSIYQLPTISADTNAGTGAMSGASESFSRAGTVFGELRKSILDEEQRKIENDYKNRVMEENIRQFDQNLLLHRDQLGETSRHNRASESLEDARNRMTMQHYQWAHQDAQAANAAHMLSARASMANNALLQQERADKLMRSRAGMLFSQFTQAKPDEQLAIAKDIAANGDNSNPIQQYMLQQMNAYYKNPAATEEDRRMMAMKFKADLGDEKAADGYMKWADKQYERALTADKNIREFENKNYEASIKNAENISRAQRTTIRSEEPLYRKALLEAVPESERGKIKSAYLALDKAMQDSYDNEGSTPRWFERILGGKGNTLNFNGSTDWFTSNSGKIASMSDSEISMFGTRVAENALLNGKRLSPEQKSRFIANLIRMRNELNQ